MDAAASAPAPRAGAVTELTGRVPLSAFVPLHVLHYLEINGPPQGSQASSQGSPRDAKGPHLSGPVLEKEVTLDVFPTAGLLVQFVPGGSPIDDSAEFDLWKSAEEQIDLYNLFLVCISGHGGDVVELDSQHMLVFWSPRMRREQQSLCVLEAVTCALALRERFVRVTRESAHRTLSIRLTVASGGCSLLPLHHPTEPCLRMVAQGDILDQFALRRDLVSAQDPTVVLVSSQAWQRVEFDGDAEEISPDFFSVHRMDTPSSGAVSWSPSAAVAKNESMLRQCVMTSDVLNNEFRTLTTIAYFLPLGTDDYTSLNDLFEQVFASFVDAVDATFARNKGALYRIQLRSESPTGLVIHFVFGLPKKTHEDDPVRAITAAVEASGFKKCSAAITTGRCVLLPLSFGDRVEILIVGPSLVLCEELALKAQPGDVICDASSRLSNSAHFRFTDAPAIGPECFRVTARVEDKQRLTMRKTFGGRQAMRMIGREQHLDIIRPKLLALSKTEVQGMAPRSVLDTDVLTITRASMFAGFLVVGAAGMGKTKFISEVVRVARNIQIEVLFGSAIAFQDKSPYFVWRAIFTKILGLDAVALGSTTYSHVLKFVSRLGPRWQPKVPLLSAVIGRDLPENDVTSRMTGEQRMIHTNSLLLHILRTHCEGTHCLMVLEDVHWIDAASLSLLKEISIIGIRAVLVLSTRPTSNRMAEMRGMGLVEMTLDPLSQRHVEMWICERLNSESVDAHVTEYVFNTTHGHLLFCEELVSHMVNSSLLEVRDGECGFVTDNSDKIASLQFDSLNRVIVSRFDDLNDQQRHLLKIASAWGMAVPEDQLLAVCAKFEWFVEAEVDADLFILVDLEFLSSTPDRETLFYSFLHFLMADIVYDMMTPLQRKEVHRAIYGVLEQALPDGEPTASPGDGAGTGMVVGMDQAEADGARADSLEAGVGIVYQTFNALGRHAELAGLKRKAIQHYSLLASVASRSLASKEALTYSSRCLELANQIGAEPFRQLPNPDGAVPGESMARWYYISASASSAQFDMDQLLMAGEQFFEAAGLQFPRFSRFSLVGLVLREIKSSFKPVPLAQAATVPGRVSMALDILDWIYVNSIVQGDYRMAVFFLLYRLGLAKEYRVLSHLGRGYASMGMLLALRGLEDTGEFFFRRSELIAGNCDDQSVHFGISRARTLLLANQGRYEDAVRCADVAMKTARELGERFDSNILALIRMVSLLYLGKYERLVTAHNFDRLPVPTGRQMEDLLPLLVRHEIAWRTGRRFLFVDSMRALAETSDSALIVAGLFSMVALTEVLGNNTEAATKTVSRALSRFAHRVAHTPAVSVIVLGTLVNVCVTLYDQTRRRTHRQMSLSALQHLSLYARGSAAAVGLADYWGGAFALVEGRTSRATKHLVSALYTFREQDMPFEIGQTCLLLGRMDRGPQLSTKLSSGAIQYLEEAKLRFSQINATVQLERVDQVLQTGTCQGFMLPASE